MKVLFEAFRFTIKTLKLSNFIIIVLFIFLEFIFYCAVILLLNLEGIELRLVDLIKQLMLINNLKVTQ